MSSEIPRHWEKHGDAAIVPSGAFRHPNWHQNDDEILAMFCDVLKVKRLFRQFTIADDQFRSPKVEFLFGNSSDPWVTRIDNGIRYTWDLTRSMFSSGNITEKLRIAAFDCSGETVVDLFAGIGYFVLPYLVHAKAAFVHACEWNPAAVEALKKNLALNSISDGRYAIHQGDNRSVCPPGVADRVNLGLIPSSEMSYEVACRALKRASGGILHIHGNVSRRDTIDESPARNTQEVIRSENFTAKYREWETWAEDTAREILQYVTKAHGECQWQVVILFLTRVKSFAPKVDHLVLDLKCQPIKQC